MMSGFWDAGLENCFLIDYFLTYLLTLTDIGLCKHVPSAKDLKMVGK